MKAEPSGGASKSWPKAWDGSVNFESRFMPLRVPPDRPNKTGRDGGDRNFEG